MLAIARKAGRDSPDGPLIQQRSRILHVPPSGYFEKVRLDGLKVYRQMTKRMTAQMESHKFNTFDPIRIT